MRNLPVLAGLALVVTFGLAEGLWTNRWGWSGEPGRAAARLAHVPRTVGAWEGHDERLDPRQVARAEMSGYLLRRFMHSRSGASLTVLLVCGRPGPTALHPPDVCYAGAGYVPTAPPQRRAVAVGGSERPAEFWVATFRKGGAAPDPLRLYWAWNAAGDWTAPDWPRLEFARYGALYKLYVIRPLSRPDEPLADDPGAEFLRAFLPEVRKALFPRP